MTNTTDKKLKDKYTQIDNLLGYLLICIGIIGFVLYYGEKKFEYGKRFNHLTFLLGKPVCRKYIIPTKYARNLSYVLKSN